MKRNILLLVTLCFGTFALAQEAVRFGDREVYLETNVNHTRRGNASKTSSLELGTPAGEKLNVLIQFEKGKGWTNALSQKGVLLGDYLGNGAYYASVPPGGKPSDFFGTGLRVVTPIRGAWKLPSAFVQKAEIPSWVAVGDKFKMSLAWFESVGWEYVKRLLDSKALEYGKPSLTLREVTVTATREELEALAENEAIAYIQWCEPPRALLNRGAAQLSGGTLLRLAQPLGGRGLTGKGEKIGLWDSNVGDHVDYGNRVHCVEFEDPVSASEAHGMHVAGTVIGAGLLDEQGKGIAPEAELWTNNFDLQSNGLSVAQEMYNLWKQEKISLTQNSYGAPLQWFCNQVDKFSYSFFHNQNSDIIALLAPTLTHVYALGNEQGKCNMTYGALTNNMKNVISVGAVNVFGTTTSFSSYGPTDDGRILPTLCARGASVFSTINDQRYERYDGTSMACPTVTGHLALLTQRYRQLNGGATPLSYFLKALVANTARDAGRPGPDYQYGFGILDAVAAAEVLENKWYTTDEIASGSAAKTVKINVPEGVKQLRVMLCWNDPVSRKEYAHGEKALINDLDLSVVCGGATVLPWTLKKDAPTENAVRARNEVDNIEQVTIDNPTAGETSISIAANVKMGDAQSYAVVWYYDFQKPQLFSPLPEEIYEPGEMFYLRAENMVAPLRVELSVDGGKTYQNLGEYPHHSAVRLPSELKPTNKALLRVTDRNGVVQKMDAPFTVMHQVKRLNLEDAYCTTAGWKLTWMATEGAKEYEVLRLNLATEQYEPLATVTATEYTLKNEDVKNERNVYAVRAYHADGFAGARSIAVVSGKPAQLSLTLAQLPYFESFVNWPLKYTYITRGKNVQFARAETAAGTGLPIGSHTIRLSADTPPSDWNTPFEQRDNVGRFELCNLDLSSLTEGTKIQFVTYALMTTSPDQAESAQLRLLVDNEEIADVQGRKHIIGDDGEHTYTWDLTPFAGKKVKLALETALYDKDNRFLILYYEVTRAIERPELFVQGIKPIEAKANMGAEKIAFTLRNNSSVTMKEVPVSVQVDGKVVYSNTLKDLTAFEDREVVCTADFSYDGVEGKKFEVVARADVEGDTDPSNNESRIEVYNKGNVILMPPVRYAFLGGQWLDIPRHDSIRVTGSARFTDMGGALENYREKENSTLLLLPQTPGRVIQVTFHEWDLGAGDTLSVYTNDVPRDLKLVKYPRTDVLGGQGKMRVFISEAANGGIAFQQWSRGNKPGKGWIADVKEVEMHNQWKLVALKEVVATDGKHATVEAAIENLLPVKLTNVAIVLTQDGKKKRYVIPTLAPKAVTNFTFPEQWEITPPMRMELQAELALDGDTTDNAASLTIVHDAFWPNGSIKNEKELYIARIGRYGGRSVECQPSAKISYTPWVKLPLYTQSNNLIKVDLNNKVDAKYASAKLRVWVDLDPSDSELKDAAPELTVVPTEEGKQSYQVAIDLSQVANLEAGKCRMRLMLASDEDYAKFKAGEAIEWGHVVDITAELTAAEHPLAKDLAVVDIVNLKSGSNLSADNKLEVKVRNNGFAAVEKVKLSLKVDGVEKQTKEFTQSVTPLGGEATIEWADAHVDLSALGKHEIEVTQTEKDGVSYNDQYLKTVYHLVPPSNNLYALEYQSSSSAPEGVRMPDFEIDPDEVNVTFEGWWRFDNKQSQVLIDAPGVWLAVPYKAKRYDDNTLVLVCGRTQANVTKLPVIKYGQWQHIAVTLEKKRDYEFGFNYTDTHIYVDGVEADCYQLDNDSFSVGEFTVSPILSGAMGMFRVWDTDRSAQEIKDNRTKSVRKADGSLETDCMAEFTLTEGRLSLIASGDNHLGYLQSSDPSTVWIPIKRLIRSVEFEKQLLPSQYVAENKISIRVPSNFTAWNSVKLKFVEEWLNTKITQGGTPVTESTVLDFSAAGHTLAFKATIDDLFGKQMEQDFVVELLADRSSACDILKLSLLTAENPNLKANVEVNDPSQEILLAPESTSSATPLDWKNLKIRFDAISPNASLYYGDEKIVPGTSKAFDLSQPKLLQVVAENGRDAKFYTLQFSLPQSITWDNAKLTLPYSGVPVALDATASSALACSYYTLDPSIATINAEGKLVTVGIGTTKIVALQNGNSIYKAATTVEREVEVTRVPLTITMKPATMAQGDKLPTFQFEYAGLQFAETEQLYRPHYVVKLADGKFWNASMPALRQGSYEVIPADYTTPYLQGAYTVTCKPGTLTVTAPTTAQEVTITLCDDQNTPLENATLWCGKTKYLSDATGKVTMFLLPNKYTCRAMKEGYTPATTSFEVKDEKLAQTLILAKYTHTLTYTADDNGLIIGAAVQRVATGGTGTAVVAAPKSLAYRFKQWSDGKMEAARTEVDVKADIAVKAEFEEAIYSISYTVSEGGEFETGTQAQQKVAYGKDAAPVTVKAKPGYRFLSWSDGNTELTRHDKAIENDAELVAIFMQPYSIAWKENFDFGTKVLQHWLIDPPTIGRGWVLRPKNMIHKLHTGEGAVLMIDPKSEELYYTGRVYSPWLSLENRANANVKLSFQSWFGIPLGFGATAVLQYQFEDNNWVDAATMTASTGEEVTFTLTDAQLTGHSLVRFRWVFTNTSFESWWAIDDILVQYDPAPADAITLTYVAGDNGSVHEKGSTKPPSDKIVLVTNAANTQVVEALPASGYSFEKWSDGVTTAERTDNAFVHVRAIFKRIEQPKHTVTYSAGEHGRIEGLSYQQVEHGMSSEVVVAIPDAGFKFLKWSDKSIQNPRTDVVESDITVEALFAEAAFQYALQYDTPEHGKIVVVQDGNELSSGAKIEPNTSITITAVPDTDYKIESLTVNGIDFDSGESLAVKGDVMIAASFVSTKKTPEAVEESRTFANVRLMPNPFDNQLRITSYELRGEYTLLNAQGVVLASGVLEGSETFINTSSFPAGMYLLRLSAENGVTKTYRVVKQ